MTPLERAARAAQRDFYISTGKKLSDGLAAQMVRAVLQAIREPDEGMIVAAGEACFIDGKTFGPIDDEHRRSFTAMIDHLLAEGEGR